jgi:hypothetical protein
MNKDFINKMKHMFSKVNLETNKANAIKYAAYFIIAIMILGIVGYIYNKLQLNNANCNNLKNIYTDFPAISSFNPDDSAYKYLLRDYYVKSAYNCCSAGQFKNDYVNTCALTNCIKQGARVLDFEIYSINNNPVIATSSVDSYHVKETYNYVNLSDALQIINTNAFSGASCPNPNDPLILHFRIQSNNTQMMNKMATDIYNNIEARLLDKIYSNEYYGHNLGAVSLKEFTGKIIISVNRSNTTFEGTDLREYVNIASGGVFLNNPTFYNVQYAPDSGELIEYNKKHMTFCIPDLSPYDTNISAATAMKYGCQWIGMNFQNFDSNMEYYDLFFDKSDSAFVLKPEKLRYVPVTIPNPTPQDPNNSYTTRNVSTDYYSFSV